MKRSSTTSRPNVISVAAAGLFWLAVWQLLSMVIRERLFLPSPITALRRLWALLHERFFYLTLGNTLLHILAGFAAALLAGLLLAALSARFSLVKTLLRPLMGIIKATPVASFIILALILVGSSRLSTLISFLMVLPGIYTSTLAGIDSIDPTQFEAADLFGMSRADRLRYIYLPGTLPYVLSSMSVGMGLAWKSGVAAEVIGIVDGTVGGALYTAKIFLLTADVFAYTVVVIVVSVSVERLFALLVRRASDALME